MASLSIRNLEKSFGRTKILRGISLEIQRGEFISLLGLSGSGKTTILRCIAGLETPDPVSGEIHLNGRVLSGAGIFVPPEERNLGMVFQNYAVWPHLNVFENVAFPLRIQSRSRRLKQQEIRTRVLDALSMVRLENYQTRFAHELSGGQQQRVALARALAMSPNVLLLDEPLSNLDALLREELGAEIRRVQQALGLTTILVTHDQREALSLSDRIVVLHQGQIEAEGSPENLYGNPPSPFIAEFLSGAQSLRSRSGYAYLFMPRRWAPATSEARRWPLKVASRIYLGNEYEYWGANPEFPELIRFFSGSRLEIGEEAIMQHGDSDPCVSAHPDKAELLTTSGRH